MKLKELRIKNKLNQKDIAKLINSTQSNYGKYELETIEPNINTLIKLADYYNVSLDYLVGRNFNNDIGYLNDMEHNILKSFRQLNNNNQYKILGEIIGMLATQDEK